MTCLKAIEDYQNEFHYHLPRENRPAARRARTSPLYPVLDAMHCAWGVVNGWERALFFRPSPDFVDAPGFRFTPTDAVVAAEIAHLQRHASVMEVSGFNRYELAGPGVEGFLDHVVCGRVPTETGRVGLCYLLTGRGNVLTEATLVKLGENRYWYGSAAAAEWHDRDWLDRFKPDTVTLTEMAATHTILVVAGPKSRALLRRAAPQGDWSRGAFPWLRARPMPVGDAEVIAMSVSFSGELAFELHVPNEYLLAVWEALHAAGADFDLGHFGLYATESMRLEKGFLGWKSDLIYEYNPFEAGLERFVDLGKGDFVGKSALLEQLQRGPRRQLVSLVIDCEHAPAHGGDGVFAGARQVGSVTSGGYGHRVRENLALAYVEPDHAAFGVDLEVGILGERFAARVVEPVRYDPDHGLMRS